MTHVPVPEEEGATATVPSKGNHRVNETEGTVSETAHLVAAIALH